MDLKTLHHISYGVYVICSKNNEKINGQIANVVFQIISEPPTIGISINKKNYTHECINKSNVFSVSILSEETPMKFIGTFGFKCGKTINKFDGVKYKLGKNQIPILQEYTVGTLEAEVVQKISQGTHTLFIGKILNAELYNDNSPMTYEYYHKIKGGYSPKTAPTFYKEIDESKKRNKEVNSMEKYVCDVCGYVYDSEYGDPDNNIASGTAFQDLPDNWVCPVCGAPKSEFSKQE